MLLVESDLSGRQVVGADSYISWCGSVFYSDAMAGSGAFGTFRAGDTVFCKIDEVLRFFERLRLTRKRIVLVTGEGDLPCDEFRQRFLPANVVRWFAMNVTSAHPRVTAIPLGLGPRDDGVSAKEAEIAGVRRAGIAREKWLYVNFRPESNPGLREPIFRHYHDLRFAGADWITFQPPEPRGSHGRYADDLACHRFVLCPPGNGVDTHRMWETLAAGGIPVVAKSVAMEPFRSLPILFVNDLCGVTLEFLEAEWARISGMPANLAMLEAEYWKTLILSAAEPLRAESEMGWIEWGSEAVGYGLGMLKRRLRKSR
ncbi:MAG: hypothetical protein ACOYNN_15775 [Terrimicrobiaceae bacterium]